MAPYGPSRVTTLARDLGPDPDRQPARRRRRGRRAPVRPGRGRQAGRRGRRPGPGDPGAPRRRGQGRLGGVAPSARRPAAGAAARSTSCSPAACSSPATAGTSRCPARWRSACATAGPPATRADVEPALATSARDAALVDRAAARRGLRAGPARRAAARALGHRTAVGAAGRRAWAVRDLKATAELLHIDERTAALHVEIALAAELLAVGDRPATATRCGCPPTPSTCGARRRSRTAGRGWRWPGSSPPGWSGWSAAARPASRSTRWSPTSSGRGCRRPGGRRWSEVAGARARHGAGRRHRRRRRWSSGWPGCARAVPRSGPRRSPGWSRSPRSSASPRSAGCPRTAARCCPSTTRSTTRPAALEPLLPEPIDHVLLQADLTAVAPGPLEQDLARHLGAVADIESRGGATVYRFTEALGPPRLRLRLVGGRGARASWRRRRGPRCRRR